MFFSLGAWLRRALKLLPTQAPYHGAVCVRGDDALNLGGSGKIEQERCAARLQVIVRRFVGLCWRSLCTPFPGVNDQASTARRLRESGGHYAVRPYVSAVELASMLLLAGLVVAFHVGRKSAGEVR